MREDLLQRFLDYLSYDTMSSPCNASAGMRPSSDGQEKLLLQRIEQLYISSIRQHLTRMRPKCNNHTLPLHICGTRLYSIEQYPMPEMYSVIRPYRHHWILQYRYIFNGIKYSHNSTTTFRYSPRSLSRSMPPFQEVW